MIGFSHNHWIEEIREYLPSDLSDEDIIKLSLSYTLQSLRNGEDFNRFKWEDTVSLKMKLIKMELDRIDELERKK